MKKAYFTALLVVLVTGSLFGSARSYLRAGRDKIMMGRNRTINQLHIQPAEYEQEKPVYYRRKSYGQVKPLGNEQGTLMLIECISYRPRLHRAGKTWQRAVSLWKRINCSQSTLRWRNFKMQQSPVILVLSSQEQNLRKEITSLSWRHHFSKTPFPNCTVFCPH